MVEKINGEINESINEEFENNASIIENPYKVGPAENVDGSAIETIDKNLDDPIDKAAKALAGIEDEESLSEKTKEKVSLLSRIMAKLSVNK